MRNKSNLNTCKLNRSEKVVNRKYLFDNIPDAFMNSPYWNTTISNIIADLEFQLDNQNSIDLTYNKLCEVITGEMDKYLKFRNISKGIRKRYRNSKPYWCDELDTLWKQVRNAETEFNKCRDHRKARYQKRERFKNIQNQFDKRLRQIERKYNEGKIQEIEKVCVDNPREFWNQIKSLGPRSNSELPMKVKDEEGNIITDHDYVFQKWKTDFEKLYNDRACDNFDETFLSESRNNLKDLESNMSNENHTLNKIITPYEVDQVTQKLKNNKSTGLDNIPNEVLKNPQVKLSMCQYFNKCFDYGKVPGVWLKSIIVPVPKGGNKDPFVPLNYRGISLLCTMTKVFTGILNNRITKFTDMNKIIVDEQNGFRKGRSCSDHIFTLTSTIKYYLNRNKSLYCTFVDLEKAFDWIERDLLYLKLLLTGIEGKIYNAIKCLYTDTTNCLRLNGQKTDWFMSNSGVRQGDTLSPNLFSLYINDLAVAIKELNIGAHLGSEIVNILLYADDMVLIAESPGDL